MVKKAQNIGYYSSHGCFETDVEIVLSGIPAEQTATHARNIRQHTNTTNRIHEGTSKYHRDDDENINNKNKNNNNNNRHQSKTIHH